MTGDATSSTASTTTTAGAFNNLNVTHLTNGCTTDDNPDVALSDPATHTIAASRIHPTTCGGDGSINLTFTGVTGGDYRIDYIDGSGTAQFFDPVSVTGDVTSSSATINTAAGTYGDLSLTLAGCLSAEYPDIVLIDPAIPSAPTVTFSGAYCFGDAIVSPTNLQWYSNAGLSIPIATIDPTSPTNSELGFSSSSANTTTVYLTQSINSCESLATSVTLTVNDQLSIVLGTLTYPGCGSTDGSIQLTGLANNTAYQIDYIDDGSPVNVNSTSDGSGNVLITNLGGSSLTNINITQNGCTSNTLTGPVKLIDASTSAGLIVNEASNGGSGSEDWVELLVIGDANNPTANVDISGWFFDDNNGDFEGAASTGVATGSIFFGSAWNSIPPGSLIVIYNQSDKDPEIGTDDPDDTGTPDGVYILPGNHMSLEGCTSATYDCTAGATAASWSRVAFRNTGDVAQVRMPNGTFYHGFSYGDVNTPFPTFPCGGSSFNAGAGGAGSNFTLSCGDWTSSTNYSDSEVRSPGAANPTNNQTLIDNIK